MDVKDIKIIISLILNSRLTYREIGEHLGLSLNAVYKRVQNLVDSGIIERFRARINIHAIGAFYAFIFGQSQTRNMDNVIAELKENKNTSTILLTSRNFIYVGAFLKDVHELGGYSSFVSNVGNIQSPSVGLRDGSYYSNPVKFIYPRSKNLKIDKLDSSIIRVINKDSRKPISEIADDVSSTPNTVRRRLTRLVNEGLIELTLDVYLEDTADIFTFLLINLDPTADRVHMSKLISEKYQPYVMFCWTFSNLPTTILCWVWTNTIKQLNNLIENLKTEKIESVETDIIRKGLFLDTWVDDLLYKENSEYIS
ncbi:MAG: winged helix-turn-helix transcriptional regulator [Promethearchaeota archaeon]|jgi:DNA-binding Lrp family transcriptional regulator